MTLPTGCVVPYSGLVTEGPDTDPLVSVTFDEHVGPYTRKAIETFKAYDMHGTFFCVGEEAEARPGLVRWLMLNGHEIGNHSWRHVDLTAAHNSGEGELYRCTEALEEIAGYEPCLMRPPYGRINDDVVATATDLGMTTVKWTKAANIFDSDPERIADNTLSGVGNGWIILLHQIEAHVAALPYILQGLDDLGLASVPVTELFGGSFT